ncbi:MAG: ribulose 1,5-bisphosphate carboxylase large subunit [Chloroflexi bacterium]|nr:ribulose 1,5-bisphosphate carboxylase large subunit [Chloroflexota bacterium]
MAELSGERFRVWYRLSGDAKTAREKAEDICVEQTVEFPRELVQENAAGVIGQVESFEMLDPTHSLACITFAAETVGTELTQLINVVFGNISLKPGIRVERIELSAGLLGALKGPRLGRDGLRARLGVLQRPLLCTALKPMGLAARDLAKLAYELALGGIDIIKDDHGLADQSFAPYRERVQYCVEQVERANRETGYRCIYVPNVTASNHELAARADFARRAGAGGLLVAPGLTGFDAMRSLADDDRIALPILSHPAFQGSMVTNPDNGFSHYALFGQLPRIAGADATIFPNCGGRFSFSCEECASIAQGTLAPMGHLKPIFPTPGGGMSLERVPKMLDIYGRDVIFLIGGGLHQHGSDLIAACRYFHKLVATM